MDYMTMNFNRNGGGGGTSDYSQLTNKPSINDVTLVGNKTASDLGLMPEYEVDETPTEDSNNLITSGAVYEADEEIKDELEGSKTVSGNPITVSDAEPMNAESVVVELEPKQDLHGYNKPWAGGAGKNKLHLPTFADRTTEGITFKWIDDSTISIKGTATNNAYMYDTVSSQFSLSAGTYTFSCNLPFDYSNGYARIYKDDNGSWVGIGDYIRENSPATFTLDSDVGIFVQIIITNGQRFSEEFYTNLQIESGNQATDFEPYSNICPISGYSEVNVENNTDTYTVSLGGTKYGGVLDVTSGVLTVTHGEIASYAGETLPSEWISDRDEYEAGTTPTTGAQVVYELATPTSVSTTPTDITLLENTNNISTDGTNIQLKYQPNNVIGECKAYTDEQVQKVLPTPPTTDGTYHLECSVSGGIPTISWVLNS